MINELQELLTMVKNVPDAVVNVLLGFAIYKIIIFLGTSAGIYGTIRLGINKWHDYKIKKMESPKVEIVKYQVRDKFIDETTYAAMEGLFSRLRSRKLLEGGSRYVSSYLHSDDVAFLVIAFEEKLKRDKGAV